MKRPLQRDRASRLEILCGLLLLAAPLVGQEIRNPKSSTTADGSSSGLAIDVTEQAVPLHVSVGRSALLSTSASLRRVYVGDPAVLGAYTSGLNEVVLTAKQPGVSTVVLWDGAGSHRMYTVFADLDPVAVRASVRAAFPNSNIEVATGESKIVLTGSVATADAAASVVRLVSSYSKDVVNSLLVQPEHGKQVELKLRVVEVDRTRAQQLGINLFSQASTHASTSTGQFPSGFTGTGQSLTATNPLNIFLYSEQLNLAATIQDLEYLFLLQVLDRCREV